MRLDALVALDEISETLVDRNYPSAKVKAPNSSGGYMKKLEC